MLAQGWLDTFMQAFHESVCIWLPVFLGFLHVVTSLLVPVWFCPLLQRTSYSHVAGNDTTSQILLCVFSFCQRTLGRLKMTSVCCLSNSSTKCCFSITIHLRNCLSHYLYPNCLKQMALYTLNSCPNHFNHYCPVIWDSSPERGKRKASTFTL